METRNRQVGGSHYSSFGIQPWDIIDEYNLDFHSGCALKYLLRDKEPMNKAKKIEDLQKAIHCIEHRIEVLEARSISKTGVLDSNVLESLRTMSAELHNRD